MECTVFATRARAMAEAQDAILCVSAVTAWEIVNKVRLGKWPEAATLADTFLATMTQYAFEPLAVTIEHARFAGFLPSRHRDPFDRMLAAQARIENIPLVSIDPVFRELGVDVLW